MEPTSAAAAAGTTRDDAEEAPSDELSDTEPSSSSSSSSSSAAASSSTALKTVVDAHAVSAPEASSPAALVNPAAHATHAFPLTLSFAAHSVASQVVSAPEASSPAALIDPAAHATHALDATRWFEAHSAPSHVVSAPEASSPAALVVPAAQATHAFPLTLSFASHAVAAHAVSPAYGSSPAALVVPAAHDTHAPADTRSFAAHAAAAARVSVSVCLLSAPYDEAVPAEISTVATPVRSLGAVHVRVPVALTEEDLYCRDVPVHVFAVKPEMVAAVPALVCTNAPPLDSPLSVTVTESPGAYVVDEAVMSVVSTGVAPMMDVFVMTSSPELEPLRSHPTLFGFARARALEETSASASIHARAAIIVEMSSV